MSVSGRQPIVSLFNQGNIIPALIITAVATLFYYDGLQVYIHGEIWWDFIAIEQTRSNFYFDPAAIRPVAYATEDLIRFIFGLNNPLPFHVTVLWLHAANSILVFLILKKVTNSLVGLSGALLFTSFYAHPDIVIYHYGITEALRATLCISCIMLFYKYRVNPTRTNYVLTLVAFILALGSRETTALILQPLMYLVDRYLLVESKTNSVKLKAHIPFIMISIAWLPLISMVKGYVTTDWTGFPINLYLSAVTSFNLCSLKGPGAGTSVLILSLVLSCLPLFDMRTRRSLILLWVGWLITIIPLIAAGMNLRYLYITSAFSMAIFTVCVYQSIVYVVGRLRLKEAYITALTILVISVPVSTNFLYVNRHLEYLKDTGRLSESMMKRIQADFPTGTLGTKLVFINFPYVYEPAHSGCIGVRHLIWGDFPFMLASVYGLHNVGPIYQFTLSEFYNGRHPLGPDIPKLSPVEFEKLAMEKGTKVYLFNPRNETILDTTGKNYNSLRGLISNNSL